MGKLEIPEQDAAEVESNLLLVLVSGSMRDEQEGVGSHLKKAPLPVREWMSVLMVGVQKV